MGVVCADGSCMCRWQLYVYGWRGYSKGLRLGNRLKHNGKGEKARDGGNGRRVLTKQRAKQRATNRSHTGKGDERFSLGQVDLCWEGKGVGDGSDGEGGMRRWLWLTRGKLGELKRRDQGKIREEVGKVRKKLRDKRNTHYRTEDS